MTILPVSVLGYIRVMLQRLIAGIIFLLLPWGICHVAFAQSQSRYIIQSSRLTVEDGLITNAALCGLQDSRGFIWIGTTEGLQRYDGKLFRLFNKGKGGLQENKVSCMAEDPDGKLWLLYNSSEDRLSRAGRLTDIMDLKSYATKSLEQRFGKFLPFPQEDLKWLCTDDQRNLFLITADDAVWWYRGHGQFKLLLKGNLGLEFYPHSSVHQAHGGSVWLSSHEFIVRLDTSGHFTRLSFPAASVSNVFQILPNGSCFAFALKELPHLAWKGVPRIYRADADGRITPSALHFLSPVAHPTANAYLLEYRADVRSRNVIIHNPRIGLKLITDSESILLIDTATLAAEPPLSPYAYFTDRSGGHWLCSPLGVFRFRIYPNYFSNCLTRAQLPAATAVTNQARGIWADVSGQVYIARDGLYRLTDSNHALKRLTQSPTFVVQGERDTLWFSNDQYLMRMSLKSERQQRIRSNLKPGQITWSLHRSRSGRLYVGGDRFIGFIQADSIVLLAPGTNRRLDGTCYQFLEDRNGVLWAVTDDGLFAIHESRYEPYSVAAKPLPSTRLHYIYDDGNDWWICTAGDGLVRWNHKSGAVRRYSIDDGLPSNVLYGCLPDRAGLFWISSNNGLIRFNPRTGGIRTFTKKDGLPDNEFNRISFHKAADERLYFGGLNGVTAFYPEAIPYNAGNQLDAPLQVTGIQQFNARQGKLLDKSADFANTGSILLEPDERFLELSVRLLDYTPGPHRYDYRIEGLDSVWRSSEDGIIRLEHTPYGSYTLHVRGKNTAWSSQELRIPLRVLTPFYRRLPFIIGAIIAFLLTLLVAIRARVRILHQVNKRLERTIAQRTNELRQSLAQKDVLMKEIHHRVKNNLQVISALQQMQAARSTDPQVKEALEEAQNRVLSIAFIHHNLYQREDLTSVELQSFVHELAGHILDVCTTPGKRINLTQDVADVTLDIDTAVPLGLIINELFTNSCKHAFNGRDEGHITISLHAKGQGSYVLEYEDDGPGLKPEIDFQKADSLGLMLINQLTLQLDGSIIYTHDIKSRFILAFQDFESRNKD